METDPRAPSAASSPEARCAVCGDRLAGPARDCPRCETPHHPECWEYNEGCAVFGCKAALVVVREQASELVVLDEEVEESPTVHDVYHSLALLPPAVWRLLAGVLLFTAIGLVSTTASLPGFFGLTSLVILSLPVAAVILMLAADAIPSVFMALSRDRPLPEFEETPLKRLEARLTEAPENPHLLEMVAFGCYAEGRFEDSLELYDRLLVLQPKEGRAHYQRAKCLHRLGRSGEARTTFEALAADTPSEDMRDKCRFWIGLLERGRDAGVSDEVRGADTDPGDGA